MLQEPHSLALTAPYTHACILTHTPLQARDIVSDVNAFHEAVWTEALQVAERSQVPTAHRGFLARSKAIDVQELYQLATDRCEKFASRY